MSLPVYLTFIRVVMSPVFLILYLYAEAWGLSFEALPYALLAVLAVCELSDIFDGFLARRHNKVTDLGKVLDPMADSLFRLTVFLSFTQGVVQAPLILVLILFLRDSIVNSLRTLCAIRGRALGARLSGKIKAVIQAVVIFFILILMIPYSLGYVSEGSFQQMSCYAVAIAAVYTLISGIEYIWANRRFIRESLKKS